MKKYSFKLVELKKEFILAIVNGTTGDLFMESKRTVKKGSRVVAVKCFLDKKNSLQEQLFIRVPVDMAGGVNSFSIPNSRATIEITANFHFSIKDIKTNDDYIQIIICGAEN